MGILWKHGDKVWYEPSDGVLFAGVVLGNGSLPETCRVMLCAPYWMWKSDFGRRGVGAAPAIASSALTRRDDAIRKVDVHEETGIALRKASTLLAERRPHNADGDEQGAKGA